jgi:superfamily II DNA or RNA helicase
MRNSLDGLYWVDTDGINLPKVQSKLTGCVTDYTGNITPVKLWSLKGKRLGVPREWGIKNFGDDFIDNTFFPSQEWPSIKFPEGGGYWAGQSEAVDDIVQSFASKHGALLEAPCGSGKTLMALDIASKMQTKTLIVVHKGDLSDQWHKTADLWPDIKMGHCQQSQWDFEGCHAVTAMAQTLYSRKDDLPQGFLEAFGLVIFDEGHRYPARTFEQVLRMFPAKHRLAVSATWRRKDELDYVWHWHVGSIEHQMRTERLTGKYVQIPWKTSIRDSFFSFGKRINVARYITTIARSSGYNVWLAGQVAKAYVSGRRVLVVSDRVEQLQYLRKKLLETPTGASVGLYVGSVDKRRLSKDQLTEAKGCGIVLATYGMMSEGTDIPELDTLFFATPRSDVEQVVGRIQRFCDGKKELLIVDPYFSTTFNKRMAGKRKRVFERLDFTNQEINDGSKG